MRQIRPLRCRSRGNWDSAYLGQDSGEGEFAKAFSGGLTAIAVSPSLCLWRLGRLRLDVFESSTLFLSDPKLRRYFKVCA